jgi:orotidine-5'-phosphate decarboxylase
MTAKEKLINKNDELKFVCVGLDSDLNKLPNSIRNQKDPIDFFNKKIIEATKNYAAAYKINFAFYEVFGSYGFDLISKTLEHIPKDILVIADAKRGDIANTSEMYAKSVFEHFNFDSITINPYMGFDSIEPFLNYKDKLNFILALTSNPGASDFEKLELKDEKKLYQYVVEKVQRWNEVNNNCGIVFGATNPTDLSNSLDSFGNCSVLLPGVGIQGGSFEQVLNIFKTYNRKNFLVNLSRSIIYADSSDNFYKVAEKEIINLNKRAELIFTN